MPLSEVSGGLLDSEFLRLASQSEGTENLKVCFCMHPSHKTSLFDHLSTGSLWITRFSHKYPLCQPFTGRHLTGYAVANLKPRKGIATFSFLPKLPSFPFVANLKPRKGIATLRLTEDFNPCQKFRCVANLKPRKGIATRLA